MRSHERDKSDQMKVLHPFMRWKVRHITGKGHTSLSRALLIAQRLGDLQPSGVARGQESTPERQQPHDRHDQR